MTLSNARLGIGKRPRRPTAATTTTMQQQQQEPPHEDERNDESHVLPPTTTLTTTTRTPPQPQQVVRLETCLPTMRRRRTRSKRNMTHFYNNSHNLWRSILLVWVALLWNLAAVPLPLLVQAAASSSNSRMPLHNLQPPHDDNDNENHELEYYTVPTIAMEDLTRLAQPLPQRGRNHQAPSPQRQQEDEAVWKTLHEALSTTGLVAIAMPQAQPKNGKTDSSFAQHRQTALNGLCQCRQGLKRQRQEPPHQRQEQSSSSTNHHNNPGGAVVDHVVLPDGRTRRTTVGIATAGTHQPLPLTQSSSSKPQDDEDQPNRIQQACDAVTLEAMEALRDDVAWVTQTFVQAMDQYWILPRQQQHEQQAPQRQSPQSPYDSSSWVLRHGHGGGYATLSSIQEAALHLEHFHLYESPFLEPPGQPEAPRQPPQTTTPQKRRSPGPNRNSTTTPRSSAGESIPTTTTTSTFHHSDSSSSSPWTLDWHVDAGLFLTFVPARICSNGDDTEGHDDTTPSFWISRRSQNGTSTRPEEEEEEEARPVRFPPNSIVLAMGLGAQEWLHLPSLEQQDHHYHHHSHHPQDASLSSSSWLKAARHAVRLQPGQVRTWYGMSTYYSIRPCVNVFVRLPVLCGWSV